MWQYTFFTAICFFVRICTSLCCVGHLCHLISYDLRVATHRSTNGQLFRVMTAILSPQSSPSIFVIYNSHLQTICYFHSLLIDLSWVLYVTIVVPSDPLSSSGNVTAPPLLSPHLASVGRLEPIV